MREARHDNVEVAVGMVWLGPMVIIIIIIYSSSQGVVMVEVTFLALLMKIRCDWREIRSIKLF